MPCKKPDLSEASRKPRCVRRLNFGPDEASDVVHNVGNLEQLLAEERVRSREIWNFDFENEEPLDGRWQWERILVPLELGARQTGVLEESEQPNDDESAHEPEH